MMCACLWPLHPETTDSAEMEQRGLGSRIEVDPLSSKK